MKGIIFSGWSVNAIAAGRKTQTRRPITFGNSTVDGWVSRAAWDNLDWQSDKIYADPGGTELYGPGWYLHVPHKDANWGSVHRVRSRLERGDVAYVKEELVRDGDGHETIYAADGEKCAATWLWNRSRMNAMFMPRLAARYFIRVTDVRAQRLQDINWIDAFSEGCEPGPGHHHVYAHETDADREQCLFDFRERWNKLNGKRSPWERNDWVWAYTFERTEATR